MEKSPDKTAIFGNLASKKLTTAGLALWALSDLGQYEFRQTWLLALLIALVAIAHIALQAWLDGKKERE
jgi:hypothetical protein